MSLQQQTARSAGWHLDNTYARLPAPFFAAIKPEPVKAPSTVIFNEELAETLGLDVQNLQEEKAAAFFSGNQLPDGAAPIAQAYTGHQFGHFTMLGDGRAHVLGEHISPSGVRVDIQLKGSGRTPFSRSGDGRAALGPMLREYIISEAMHALGVPTTRSLAVVTTGEPVYRDTVLPGAVLCRVASSHIRVGTFQYAAALDNKEFLRTFTDYTIQRHDPDVAVSENPTLAFLERVVDRQAQLIAKWMLIGFIHGVMNTDNVAISGETIDYGPCAFMDTYRSNTVFSSIDRQGRYAYDQQPRIAQWNLARFAETLLPLLHEEAQEAIALAEPVVNSFGERFETYWLDGMRDKLGLLEPTADDTSLIADLLERMQSEKLDFTNTFAGLTRGDMQEEQLGEWSTRWQERRGTSPEAQAESTRRMRQTNPVVIPRNHLVEEALAAAETDLAPLHNLLDALREPYNYDRERNAKYTDTPPINPAGYCTYCGT